MTAIPLAQYLSEFEQRTAVPFRNGKPHRHGRAEQATFEHLGYGSEEEPAPVLSIEADAEASFEDAAPALAEIELTPEPSLDLDDVREKAFCDGRESMRAEMEAVFAETLAEERAKAEKMRDEAVAEARKQWIGEEAERMAERFATGLERLENTVKTALSAVLMPVATGARQQRTVEELIGAIRTMALDGKSYQIVASGPEDLLNMLSEKLGEHRKLVTFEAGETAEEVRVSADTTVIETRLSSWRRALEEALS
ncbi:hypothetical protein [Consotaella salsifontis]|uniref:Flagellar assembly protein FliH n=1 Tax=Consotaella salsifontis TaxID=1365950 RepID=A0A1T4NS53_9HYPH|nr:hypothetical protein [Consotaella salsifontis]SJZ81935.1 hypothetical protein SAMN05428963_103154 [Consotaella salsifontis]